MDDVSLDSSIGSDIQLDPALDDAINGQADNLTDEQVDTGAQPDLPPPPDTPTGVPGQPDSSLDQSNVANPTSEVKDSLFSGFKLFVNSAVAAGTQKLFQQQNPPTVQTVTTGIAPAPAKQAEVQQATQKIPAASIQQPGVLDKAVGKLGLQSTGLNKGLVLVGAVLVFLVALPIAAYEVFKHLRKKK